MGFVVAIVIWLYGNYIENASRQNIPTDFGFLDNPAGVPDHRQLALAECSGS